MYLPNKILVLDWGIGGLSVWKEIRQLRPDLALVYVSDSGFTPYGKVPSNALAKRVAQVVKWAQAGHQISHVVIACNAASTVRDSVQTHFPLIPVLGVIAAGIALVRESGCRKVGVIGGLRTIESKVFSTALADEPIEILEQIAQPLSALIERGVLSGPELEQALAPILAPLQNVEALLLACTHYPAIAPSIARALPRARLLDPARRVAEQLVKDLLPPDERTSEPQFYTSGSVPQSESAALAAFGVRAKFLPWEPGT